MVQEFRERRLIQSITRKPIKEGLDVHLSQITVRIYLGKIRDALGCLDTSSKRLSGSIRSTGRMQLPRPSKAGRP